jgi:4-amino-4-deoxy-L-arabinose transferase-like glycosyltransferase
MKNMKIFNNNKLFDSLYPVLLILLIALIIRISAAVFLGNEVSGLSGANDEISYSILGYRFASGYGLTFPEFWYPWISAGAPQSYYSATMSLFLGIIYLVFGYYPLVARLIMALLSTIVVGLIYLLSKRIFNTKVALLSAIIATFYAYLIFYGATLVTETPFILFLLITLYLTYELQDNPSLWKWIAFGVALSVAVLLRMAVIFLVPILFIWLSWNNRKQLIYILIPVVIIILSILPFTIRNYQLWNRFLLLEAQFGHVFWNGNHPDSNGDFHPYRVFPIPDDVLVSQNDAEITNRLFKMGVENVIENPGLFVSLTITRLREFFKFWPTQDSNAIANLLRVISFGLMWPFAVLGLWLVRAKWKMLIPILLFMFIHTSIYATSWTMIRYRIPLDAVLIIFSAIAIIFLIDKFVKKKSALKESI